MPHKISPITPDLLHFADKLSPELCMAVRATKFGGEALLNYWKKLNAAQIREKHFGDLVTEADLRSEELVTNFLSKEMPEAAIQSEEGTERAGKNLIWYLDPLDGTTNFVQRFPVFAVSLALADISDSKHPVVVCGVVFNPASGEIFLAANGKGSYLGNQRLAISTKVNFADTLIATGFPRRHSSELPRYLKEFAAIYPHCRGIRRAGAAALDLCWTAQGIFDGFWEHKLSPWDIAAGVLMVEEAGGLCTDFNGRREFLESGNIVGASKIMHAELLARIQSA